MAYFTSRKIYLTRSLRRIALFVLLGIVVAVVGVTMYTRFYGNRNMENLEISTDKKAAGIQISILKAKQDITIGGRTTSMDFDIYEIDAEFVPENAVSDISKLKGMRVIRDIKKNEILKSSDMVEENYFFKSDDRLMEQAFSAEGIPSDCKDGSIIDIRLFRPGENDPVVISKVFVMKRVESSLTMFMDMKEQELLKQSIKEGALYILMYGDPSQEASMVDYIPNYRLPIGTLN